MSLTSSNNNQINWSNRNTIVSLLVIGAIGLFLRLELFPSNIPLVLDALDYFLYATDVSVIGHATPFIHANNGWPLFLSFFFTLFKSNNALAYMTFQRQITVCLSILTIIPLYQLSSKFIQKPFAILVPAIFCFEPHLILNSLQGITEPLFIFLTTLTLSLLTSTRKSLNYVSFAIIGFASLVRAEALFVFVPSLVMFAFRLKIRRNIIFGTLIAISIFLSIIIPMAIFRIQSQGNDQLTGRILFESQRALSSNQNHIHGFTSYLLGNIEKIVSLSGSALIPAFIILVPIGLAFMLKQVKKNTFILALIVSMMLPVLYSFTAAPDTRYIYPLFPLFSIVSVFALQKFLEKTKNQKILLISIVAIILVSSIIFLEYKKPDYEYQKESFEIAKKITNVVYGINDYQPEDSYIIPAQIPEKWPAIQSSIDFKTKIIPTKNFTSLSDYIESSKGKGLTHLVIDDSKKRPNFLSDVFWHEEKYPYLEKIFDSTEHSYKYHLKIFRINYEKFNTILQ
jgi:hypothetical protein